MNVVLWLKMMLWQVSLGGAFSIQSYFLRCSAEAGGAIFGSIRFAFFCCAVVSLEAVVVRAKKFKEQQVFHLGH